MTDTLLSGAFRALGTAALAVFAFAPDTGAQVDFRVSKIELNQALPSGTAQNVAGRAVMVRTSIRMLNDPGVPQFIDAIARVYIDGVEADFSPLFSNNGPVEVIQPADPLNEDHTLNFQFIGPESNDVDIVVTLNPPGPNQIFEADFSNNTDSKNDESFKVNKIADLAYAPIDSALNGGLPPEELIEPGVGDNFIQAIYPVADWDYRRIDAPSKVWTQSLSSSGSALNNSLTADYNLMVPQPAYIYGWVNGGLPYNGQAIINGVASMGNTQSIRHQRTFAHEMGHCTGLFHHNSTSGQVGVDVEHHLAITQGLPKLFATNKFDVMVAGLLTNQAWVYVPSYNNWLNHPKFQVGADQDLAVGDTGPGLFVAGVWNSATGEVEMTDVFELPGEVRYSQGAASSEILLHAFSGGRLVRGLAVAEVTSSDCAGRGPDQASPEVGFTAIVPAFDSAGAPIDRVMVSQGGSRGLTTRVLERSAHAPEVAFTSPTAGALAGNLLTVSWEGVDADGDELTYYLRYSRDGASFSPIHTSTHDTSFTVDMGQLPKLVNGQGFFELFATDGLNTTVVRTEPLSLPSFAGGGNAPWAHISTPDDGNSFEFGATVILHGMGWDLEDKSIQGGDVVWTSSLDGVVGTGRRLTHAGFSVGTHVLTMTVTDSDGQFTTDTTTITINDRGLPDVDEEICQADLGFGGPGTSVLSICGGDLSAGNDADLLLTGAPASTTAYMVVGVVNAPAATKGGVLVPVPPLVIDPKVTDAAGEFTMSVPGGFGPLTAYVQFVSVDLLQPQGYGFSNAVQVEFLP